MLNPRVFYDNGINDYGMLGAKQHYYNEYLNKYAIPTPQPMLMEQIKTYKHLLPGKLYTFNYSPITDNLSYYDGRPIILSIKNYTAKTTGNNIEFGINFNFIPTEIRKFLIYKLYDVYKSIFEKNQKHINEGNFNKQIMPFIGTYDYMLILEYLWNGLGKTGYKFALRNYIFERLENLKTIDYDDWGMVLFIDSKDMTGAKLEDIYKEYWAYRRKTL